MNQRCSLRFSCGVMCAAIVACNADPLAIVYPVDADLGAMFPDGMSGAGDLARRNHDAVCAMTVVGRTLGPPDIVLVVDNSGSMVEEVYDVERNINFNFSPILSKSGVDYRVILFSSHGDSRTQKICVGPPLSRNQCDPFAPM